MIALDFLLEATGGTAWRTHESVFHGVAIDGRSVGRGGVWFAIRGERFDGHLFASQAIDAGAACLCIERGRAAELILPGDVTIVEVDDTVQALGRLARAHRLRLPELVVIAVTGSYGKTTTKEIAASILAAHAGHAAVHKTEGNFNNHLGLPLTLLRLTEAHRFAVIEMGMSAPGEIAYLAELAVPDLGAIVSVGPVHLEHLGSLAAIAHAKGELFAALPPSGALVFPDGDALIAAEAKTSRAQRKLRFGTRAGVDVRILEARVSAEGTLVTLRLPDGTRVEGTLAAIGAHHAHNAAAAAALCSAAGASPQAIARGLAGAASGKHRSTIVEVGGRHVLDDCYNASPPSTVAALDALRDLRSSSPLPSRAIAVLGDMLELGPDAPMLHRNIGEHAAARADAVWGLGPLAREIVAGARRAGMPADRARASDDPEAIAADLAKSTQPGDWILVKASRGMKLERVIDALRAALQQSAPAASHNEPPASQQSPGGA